MKQFWLGLGILAALLGLSLLVTWGSTRALAPIEAQLRAAEQAAMGEDMTKCEKLAREARADWERVRPWLAAVADHSALEDADSLFEELQVYTEDSPTAAAAACARLGAMLEALGEAHALSIPNLL